LDFYFYSIENIFSNELKTGNNKISFLVEIRNLILSQMKTAITRNVILSKSKNTFSPENAFLVFLFLESRKQEVKSNMFSEF